MAFRIVQHDSVPTTNDLIKDAIKQGQPEGLVHCAFKQTAGYGRQGRTWVSPYGGLYASFLLRPDVPVEQISTVALVVALAVRDAIVDAVKSCCATVDGSMSDDRRGIEDAVKVKWPNDVVCDSGKLCGISSELIRGALCIGIGINVFEPFGSMSVSGKNVPAYVADFIPGVNHKLQADSLDDAQCDLLIRVRDSLVSSFARYYRMWESDGFAGCVDSFRSCMTMLGSLVEIVAVDGAPLSSGVVQGVADDGRLVLQDAAGSSVFVSSGEAHISRIS